jgi:hypothetical protein
MDRPSGASRLVSCEYHLQGLDDLFVVADKYSLSFAGTGTVAVVIAWFILPEVARRTPAEIDEMYVKFH